VANTAVIPLQDLLQLGSEARMNFPGRESGNWHWRYTADQITPVLVHRLSEMTELYGRAVEPADEETEPATAEEDETDAMTSELPSA
jgi:4-alpha-glucanotransferase